MENFPINPMDIAVVGVVLLAALLAFTRGLTAEALSLAAWIAAAVTAMFALPHVLPIAKNYIKYDMLAYGASAIGVFVVALVVFTIIGNGRSLALEMLHTSPDFAETRARYMESLPRLAQARHGSSQRLDQPVGHRHHEQAGLLRHAQP